MPRVIAFRVVVFGCFFLITSIYAVSCPKGTFISQSASSGCQPCLNGTYSNQINSTRCFKCDECRAGKHYRVTKACTPTSNTKCKCDEGFYFDGFLYCLKCQACRRGRGVVKNCTESSNTVCAPCVKGETYSDTKDLSRCSPCSKCEKGDFIKKVCTRKSNAVCVNARVRNVSKYTKWLVNKSTNSTIIATSSTDRKFTTKKGKPSTSRNSTERRNQWTHPPGQRNITVEDVNTQSYEISLFTLVGVAFLAFVAIIIVWFLRRSRSKNLPKPENGEEPSTLEEVVAGAQENQYSSLPVIGARQGPDKMLRDVPYTLISELAKYLNPRSRWKELGGLLNFNNTQISNFALVKENATQVMLEEWGQRQHSTVANLRKAFQELKWHKEEKLCAVYV